MAPPTVEEQIRRYEQEFEASKQAIEAIKDKKAKLDQLKADMSANQSEHAQIEASIVGPSQDVTTPGAATNEQIASSGRQGEEHEEDSGNVPYPLTNGSSRKRRINRADVKDMEAALDELEITVPKGPVTHKIFALLTHTDICLAQGSFCKIACAFCEDYGPQSQKSFNISGLRRHVSKAYLHRSSEGVTVTGNLTNAQLLVICAKTPADKQEVQRVVDEGVKQQGTGHEQEKSEGRKNDRSGKRKTFGNTEDSDDEEPLMMEVKRRPSDST